MHDTVHVHNYMLRHCVSEHIKISTHGYQYPMSLLSNHGNISPCNGGESWSNLIK